MTLTYVVRVIDSICDDYRTEVEGTTNETPREVVSLEFSAGLPGQTLDCTKYEVANVVINAEAQLVVIYAHRKGGV